MVDGSLQSVCRKNNVCPVNGHCKTDSVCYMYILCIQNANEPHHLVFSPLLASQLLVTFALFVVLKPPLPPSSELCTSFLPLLYIYIGVGHVKTKRNRLSLMVSVLAFWCGVGKRLHTSVDMITGTVLSFTSCLM